MTETFQLSTDGAHRRDAMPDVLQGAMRRRVRRRVVLRAASAAIVMVAGVATAAWWARPTRPAAEMAASTAPAMRNASLRVVQTGAVATSGMFRPIDDDELLTELRALGKPTGMIRTYNRVTLTADLRLETEDSGTAG